jgi:hypothetical protein
VAIIHTARISPDYRILRVYSAFSIYTPEIFQLTAHGESEA